MINRKYESLDAEYRERIKSQKIDIQFEAQMMKKREGEARDRAIVRRRTKPELLERTESERIKAEKEARMEVERRATAEKARVSAVRRDFMEEVRIDTDAAQLRHRGKTLQIRRNGPKQRGSRPQQRRSATNHI